MFNIIIIISLIIRSSFGQTTAEPDCESQGIVTHIDWDKLQSEYNSSQLPYHNLTIAFDTSNGDFTFDLDLEYLGSSNDPNSNNYNLGTTYIVDFSPFGTSTSDFSAQIGSCQNRDSTDFNSITNYTDMWSYSDSPSDVDGLGSSTTLAYPPSTIWDLSIEADSCTPINYIGDFSWNEMISCQDSDGNQQNSLTDVGDEIHLNGTLYVSIVSPYAMSNDDPGFYRVYNIYQQHFSIRLLKSINIISSTGVELFISSIISITFDSTTNDFILSMLTQSADYITLNSNSVLITPLGTASVSQVTSGCLSASAYTCGQIFNVRVPASQTQCNVDDEVDFSGNYQVSFTPSCDSSEAVCETFTDDNNGQPIVLGVNSTFIDRSGCDTQLYVFALTGTITFYDDVGFTIVHNPANGDYTIGQDDIYIEASVTIPDGGTLADYGIAEVTLSNVWVCTSNGTALLSNLNQASGQGGCLSSGGIIDDDGPYNIILSGNPQNVLNEGIFPVIIENPGTGANTNRVRFSFLTFAVGRTTIYVHVQLSLVLTSGRRRRLLLQTTLTPDTDTNININGESDQIRHYITNTGVRNASTINDVIIDIDTNDPNNYNPYDTPAPTDNTNQKFILFNIIIVFVIANLL